jgi:hypothetical protein
VTSREYAAKGIKHLARHGEVAGHGLIEMIITPGGHFCILKIGSGSRDAPGGEE